mmetsp:Transcript_12583/g.31700  ORF Transcript_12583/g.31700 Transcript_12583/m.31700 type:complete len:201 (-) Transcript_12583:110-712(-)
MGHDSGRFHGSLVLVLNIHGLPICVETLSSRFEDCRPLHSCVNSSDRSIVVVRWFGGSGIDISAGIDEVLKGLYTIASLSGKHAIRRRIFHKERIHRSVSGSIGRNARASVGLVDGDLALGAHKEESLLGMHVTLWCRPRTRIHGTAQCLVVNVFPLNGQRNGIFRVHALCLGHSSRSGGRNPNGTGDSGQCPLAPVNVV